MRRKILPFILGGALSIAAVAPAAAAHTDQLTVQRGGAAGLIAAVVQVAANVDDVHILNNSLNNLLQNADIDVLNNILNNSLNNNTILSNIEVSGNTVTVDVIDLGPDLTFGTVDDALLGTITSQ